jgi:uncharacterized membrane protein
MTGPISMYVPAALIAALSVPLALRLIPPNRIYGVRTSQTLASREVWFRVNRVAGFAFLAAAGVTICVYLANPDLATGRSFVGVLALVVPILLALAVTAAYARKLSHNGIHR